DLPVKNHPETRGSEQTEERLLVVCSVASRSPLLSRVRLSCSLEEPAPAGRIATQQQSRPTKPLRIPGSLLGRSVRPADRRRFCLQRSPGMSFWISSKCCSVKSRLARLICWRSSGGYCVNAPDFLKPTAIEACMTVIRHSTYSRGVRPLRLMAAT